MTSDERAFLDAICAQPDDDTARLVYADWLAENGDPDRGEFIRVDIELARTPPDSEGAERRRSVLFARRAELLKKHKTAWLAPFTPFAKESAFERGFVQKLEVPANTFVRHAENWFALTPLTRVRITTCFEWDQATRERTWWAASLFASPHLSHLESLDLEGLRITAADLEPLAAHPNLSRLRELVLVWNAIGNDGAILLANMPQLRGLESLDLRSNNLTDIGARAIALSQYLNGLKELRISRNAIHDATWALLDERFGGVLMG
jgi:uncharacterized protein (TIGR02996 family)